MNWQDPLTRERDRPRVAVSGRCAHGSAARGELLRSASLRWRTIFTTATARLRSPPGACRSHANHAPPVRSRRGHRQWLRWPLLGALAVLVLVVVAIVIVIDRRGSTRNSGDPFSGVRIFVDRHSPAAVAEASLERSDPAAATLLRKIASHPTGIWLGNWIPAVRVAAVVHTVMREAAAENSMPLLVLYAFPFRACERQVTGGLAGAAGYERWIGQVVAGIGTGKAAVILEPDVLAQFFAQPRCLSPRDRRDGLAVIRRAVDELVSSPNTAVYLDAGHSRWRSAKVMAPLLLAAGVREARGFSLNVSNFNATAAEERYGNTLSALVHGAHYVIDTSRNGAATAKTWCNPPGQALGIPPTAKAGNRLVDALLWIKPPGASDGPCNGGPPAGMFWPSYALSLAANARW